jgi:hypothetical protein
LAANKKKRVKVKKFEATPRPANYYVNHAEGRAIFLSSRGLYVTLPSLFSFKVHLKKGARREREVNKTNTKGISKLNPQRSVCLYLVYDLHFESFRFAKEIFKCHFLPPDISQFPLENLLPGQVISATFTAVSCFQELFDAQFTTDSFLIEKVVAANRRVNWCL